MHSQVAILVGSLRRQSYARKIAGNLVEMLANIPIEAAILEIGQLPLYNFDYDDPHSTFAPLPREYVEFREEIRAADGVIFVTPENNRTIPACLKNAIDIGSKPNSDVVWKGKPVAIVSHSVGKMGGYSAHKNLKLALSYFGTPMVAQPEVFLSQSPTLLDSEGAFKEHSTTEFLESYLHEFARLL